MHKKISLSFGSDIPVQSIIFRYLKRYGYEVMYPNRHVLFDVIATDGICIGLGEKTRRLLHRLDRRQLLNVVRVLCEKIEEGLDPAPSLLVRDVDLGDVMNRA